MLAYNLSYLPIPDSAPQPGEILLSGPAPLPVEQQVAQVLCPPLPPQPPVRPPLYSAQLFPIKNYLTDKNDAF